MVDKVVGQDFSVNLYSKPKPSTAKAESNFMDVLNDTFSKVTNKLQDVPGMPGVYSVNTPIDPQSISSLDMSSNTIV